MSVFFPFNTKHVRTIRLHNLYFPSIDFLQEVWACWCELLSYLEQENAFLDQLEQKLDETENLQGGAEELQEALDVSVRREERGHTSIQGT